MGHQPHLIAERRLSRVDRKPIRVGGWQIVREADLERRSTLRDHCHPERACLTGEPGAVVVRPEWRRRQIRMQLPDNLRLGERILVRASRRRDHDSGARQGQRFKVLGKSSPGGRCQRRRHGPRQCQSSARSHAGLQETSSGHHGSPLPLPRCRTEPFRLSGWRSL